MPGGVRARRAAGGDRLPRRPGAGERHHHRRRRRSTTTFWTYSLELADFSVQTQKELGIVGNGPDDTLGNMDEARIQTVHRRDPRRRPDDVPADLVASGPVHQRVHRREHRDAMTERGVHR